MTGAPPAGGAVRTEKRHVCHSVENGGGSIGWFRAVHRGKRGATGGRRPETAICGAGALFVQDRNSDGMSNGFEYAFGTNLPSVGPLLDIRMVQRPVVEIPVQDPSTLPYVRVNVRGSTNLFDWTLSVIPARDTSGKPVNREWLELNANVDKAFFKLEAELK